MSTATYQAANCCSQNRRKFAVTQRFAEGFLQFSEKPSAPRKTWRNLPKLGPHLPNSSQFHPSQTAKSTTQSWKTCRMLLGSKPAKAPQCSFFNFKIEKLLCRRCQIYFTLRFRKADLVKPLRFTSQVHSGLSRGKAQLEGLNKPVSQGSGLV